MVKTGRPKNKQGYKRVTFYLPAGDMDYLKDMGGLAKISASEYLHALIGIDRDHHRTLARENSNETPND